MTIDPSEPPVWKILSLWTTDNCMFESVHLVKSKIGSVNWNPRCIARKWMLMFMYRPDEAMLFFRASMDLFLGT